VADAAHWILQTEGVTIGLHYLDDCIFVTDDINSAQLQKSTMLNLFARVGIPVKHSKLEGPSKCLTFLGIEVDTAAECLQLRLPNHKLTELMKTLERSIEHESLPKKQLKHLTDLLQFATKVVRPGRLRRLYALQNIGRFPNHLVRLNRGAQADILWWYFFVKQWNGVTILRDLGLMRTDIQVF